MNTNRLKKIERRLRRKADGPPRILVVWNDELSSDVRDGDTVLCVEWDDERQEDGASMAAAQNALRRP